MKNKKIILIIVIAALFTAYTTGFDFVKENRAGLEGGRTVSGQKTAEGGRIERIYNEDGSYSAEEYDADGNLIKESHYHEDGTIKHYSVYKYDSDGNKIKHICYNEDGISNQNFSYEYDSKGNKIKTVCYKDGKIDHYWIYEYSPFGHVTKSRCYSGDGTLEYSSEE